MREAAKRISNWLNRSADRFDAASANLHDKGEMLVDGVRKTFATIGRGARTAAERSISGARTAVEFSTGVAVAGVEAANRGIEATGQAYISGTEKVEQTIDAARATIDQLKTDRAKAKADRAENRRLQAIAKQEAAEQQERSRQEAQAQQELARQEAQQQAEIDRQAEMARRREAAEQKAQAAAERKAKRHAKWDAMKYRAMKSFLSVKEAVKSGAGSAKEFADNRAEAAQDLVARHRDAGRAAIDAYRSTVNKEEEHPIEYNI